MTDIVSELEALSADQLRQVYSRLWLELTIGSRSIWSDDRYSETQKLDGLKWINEIQHRVWHSYMDSPGYSPAWLLDRIGDNVQQAEHIRGYVDHSLRSAINSLACST